MCKEVIAATDRIAAASAAASASAAAQQQKFMQTIEQRQLKQLQEQQWQQAQNYGQQWGPIAGYAASASTTVQPHSMGPPTIQQPPPPPFAGGIDPWAKAAQQNKGGFKGGGGKGEPIPWKPIDPAAGNKKICPDYFFESKCSKGGDAGGCQFWHPLAKTEKGICSRFQRSDHEECQLGDQCERDHILIGEEDAKLLKSECAKKAAASRNRSQSPGKGWGKGGSKGKNDGKGKGPKVCYRALNNGRYCDKKLSPEGCKWCE